MVRYFEEIRIMPNIRFKLFILVIMISIILMMPGIPIDGNANRLEKNSRSDRTLFLSKTDDSLSSEDSLSYVLSIVRKERKISDLLNIRYEDTTIYNEISLEDYQFNNGTEILFSIRQYQTGIEHSVSLIYLIYRRNSCEFFVYNPLTGKQIPISSWNSDY